jgi:hypothetical protein
MWSRRRRNRRYLNRARWAIEQILSRRPRRSRRTAGVDLSPSGVGSAVTNDRRRARLRGGFSRFSHWPRKAAVKNVTRAFGRALRMPCAGSLSFAGASHLDALLIKTALTQAESHMDAALTFAFVRRVEFFFATVANSDDFSVAHETSFARGTFYSVLFTALKTAGPIRTCAFGDPAST